MMVQTLEDDGFTMVPFGQGFRGGAVSTLEEAAADIEDERELLESYGDTAQDGVDEMEDVEASIDADVEPEESVAPAWEDDWEDGVDD